jgi:hypothetical protein
MYVLSSVSHAARLDDYKQGAVRPGVRDLLERSPAFRALGADRQQEIATGMVSVAGDLMKTADLPSQAKDLVRAVDFPDFVGGLIGGVFDAIVDSSIRQMDAYADLLKTVTDSINQFVKENVTEDQARDYLTEAYPGLASPEHDEGGTGKPPCYRCLVAATIVVSIGKALSAA